ncbi:hypothetical protein CMV_003251 [Castanea mollissima]|uniref:Transposase n=1 Tax=Castanea mollissima TaxID=60419 RepID=A0A8J4VWD3_9ROSI|nr:hypothetical protein CMV_003251 [Castanea mollissima]
MCPIRYLNWKNMPEELKEECWRVVERKYSVPVNPIAYAALKAFTLQKIGKPWRDRKSRMKKRHYIPHSRNKTRVKNNPPKGCIPEDWDILVDHWYTDDAVASLATMEEKLVGFDEMKQKLSQFEEMEQRMARMLQQISPQCNQDVPLAEHSPSLPKSSAASYQPSSL